MKYEIVEMKEKIIAGVSAVTSNDDPKMGEIIGELWGNLYQGGIISKIENRVSDFSYGLYSDYQKEGEYKVTVGCEVLSDEGCTQKELAVTIIPAGKYAKFTMHGDMVKAVQETWEKIWKMDLKRTWTGDFEEYVDSDMTGNATINIYIAIE